MKFQISQDELPRAMRTYLQEVDAGRAFYAERLQASRHAFVSALRGLIETARCDGLPERLCTETVNAFHARLTAAGWQVGSLRSQAVLLRKYAFETGEGLDWALESGASDRRPLELVFRAPHWSRFSSIYEELMEICDANIIRLADRWMRYESRLRVLSRDHFAGFKVDARSLGQLAELMTTIDPENPSTILLQQEQRKRRTKSRPKSKRPKRELFHDLPEPFFSEMAKVTGRAGRTQSLSRARLELLCSVLRRLSRVLAKHGRPIELTIGSAQLFAEDVFDSDLATRSKAAYCEALSCFANHAGYDGQIVSALMQTHNAFKHEAKSDVSRKEVKLAAQPLDLVSLAETAHALLQNAPIQDHIRARRRDYILAAAMALLTKLPLRAADIRAARVGHEFCRDSEGWTVSLNTSKTGSDVTGRLADELTPYLDAVLLMGVGSQHLWTVYKSRVGTALFGNPARSWEPFGKNWLFENMQKMTGHGPHVVRSLIYDAVVGDPKLDLKVAQALCGHAHETSRKFYELNADRYRREQASERLSEIAAAS